MKRIQPIHIDKDSNDARRTIEKRTFQYVAKTKEGRIVRGYFKAHSKLDVYSYLINEGLVVYEIKNNSWIELIHGDSFFGNRRMKDKYLIFWLTQLSTYIKSGVTLAESVKILAKQNKNNSYRKYFQSMIYELSIGESFSECLAKQGKLFPPLLINMVKAAEKIGDIESTLDEMSHYYDEMYKNKKAIKSAMTYPIIILVFAIGVISFILGYIIPQFIDVYSNLGVELNSYTQAIISIAGFVSEKWPFLILGVLGIIILSKVLYSQVRPFKKSVQYILMHIPVIGKLMIYNEMTMFSKTFAALNRNNVLLAESIDILGQITNNEVYKKIMSDTINNLLKGEKMSQSFENNWAIPELAFYMISTGESTGDLANMLDKVSDYYTVEQRTLTDQMKTFIEPIMIALLALIVGGIVLAIIIPMFDMYQNIS